MSKEKASWLVEVECRVRKVITTAECSEDEARTNPYEHAVQEEELDQMDWEVTNVTKNE